MNLYELTLHDARDLLDKKEISARDLTRAVLDRIETVDGHVGAYITVAKESALAQADAADRIIAEGDASPLAGIPLAVKDVLCTQGVRTTCASRIDRKSVV